MYQSITIVRHRTHDSNELQLRISGAHQLELFETDAAAQAKAQILVSVPTDAVIYLVGQKTKSTGAVRTFTSPVLKPGKKFGYPIRVELTRDGKTYTAEGMQMVRAGDRVVLNVEFDTQLGQLSLKQAEGQKSILGSTPAGQRAEGLVTQK